MTSGGNSREVAIVGVACTYAHAQNVVEFWQNIVDKVDAIADFPPERLDLEAFYTPDPANADQIYCKKGGWIGTSFPFNPLKFGIMPAALEGAEPDHFLVLRAIHEALEDAGYPEREIDRRRVSIVLGKGNYLGPGVSALIYRGVVTAQVLSIIKGLHPELTEERLDEIKTTLRSALPKFSAEVASGLIPNITTGRVANRLDLMGANFTIDAACASSLIATEIGVQDLLTGKYDMVLAGGVHIFSSVPFLQVFAAMRALSLSSTIRPYDEHCDGTIAGEGVGILALKRLEDAERDGDRIYALIKGVGSSSDGKAKGVTAPRVEGEELALRRAYEVSGLSPQSVELIEGHGTGTGVGDNVEIEALRRVFGASTTRRPTCAIGSVKSMIGHAMPAAGAAGLIKAALSLYHHVLPPTLNCRKPRPALLEADSPFYVNTEARPWIHPRDGEPRRAGVNAFGFGGINAHVVLEEYKGDNGRARPSLLREWESELVVVEAETRAGLIAAVETLRTYVEGARSLDGVTLRDVAYSSNVDLRGLPERIAVVAASLDDLANKLRHVRDRLSDRKCSQIKDRQGLYYFADAPGRDGKIALLFPGEGSQYLNMLAELCVHFPEVREVFDLADSTRENPDDRWPTSAIVFPPPFFSEDESKAADARLFTIDRATEAVLTADGAVLRLLQQLELKADMMMGHSAGEWVGLAAAGVLEIEELVASMGRLSAMYRGLSEDSAVPRMAMLAVGAGREKVHELVGQIDRQVYVANDNCPHQVVVVVDPADEAAVLSHLQRRGIFVEKLQYDRGYHTPAFTYICDPLRQCFSSMAIRPPRVPLYCCTTAGLYPSEPTGILDLISNAFARPLIFAQTVEAMYEAGARIFVEAGPRGNLTAFVDDILRGRPHLAVAIDQFRRPGLTTLMNGLAMLEAANCGLNLHPLYSRRSPRKLTFDLRADRRPSEHTAGLVQVSTCYPRLEIPAPIETPAPPEIAVEPTRSMLPGLRSAPDGDASLAEGNGRPHAPLSVASGDVLDEHFALMEQFLETQQAVMLGFLDQPAAESFDATILGPEVGLAVGSAVLEEPPRLTIEIASAAPQTSASPAPTGRGSLEDVLLAIVSERTGYPREMLNLDLDMEADLGIDSIKRVEILSALRSIVDEAAALSSDAGMEQVARLKTLRQVLAFLEQMSAPAVATKIAPAPTRGPLIRAATVVNEVAGKSVTLRADIDLNEHLYLRDHCLYFHGPEERSQCVPLTSMPLTCSLEWMAETAAIVVPGLRMIGAKGVQAYRRINVASEGKPLGVSIAATRTADSAVRVVMRSEPSEEAAAETLAEATVLFGEDLPQPPSLPDLKLKNPRRPQRTAAEIYSDHSMFHGPRFQGVVSLDAIADDGVLGRLKVLPISDLVRSERSPRFHVDPFLLDAGGQMVGYWPIEYLEEGFVVLPVRIEELILFREHLSPGDEADCQVRITSVSQRLMKSDFDVIGRDGKPWMRVIGWEDWRFYWDRRLYDFWRFPNRLANGLPVEIPGLDPNIECRWLDLMNGADSTGLWENLCVHMILGRHELAEHRAMSDSEARREWVLRMAIAKDAVRMWIQRRGGPELYPTEVRITPDDENRLHVTGDWISESQPPRISIAHHGHVAVAAASGEPIGVAIEPADRQTAVLSDVCERGELERIGRPEHVAIRALCAKKAAARLSGVAADDLASLKQLVVADLDADEGRFEITGDNTAAMTVRTVRVGEFIIGVACR